MDKREDKRTAWIVKGAAKGRGLWCLALGSALLLGLRPGAEAGALAQDQAPGSIRGVVTDKDFDVALAAARITAVEAGKDVLTTEQGTYVFPALPPGRYTLVFFKDGYVRQVKSDVLVSSGRLTDVDVALEGEFTEMDEFVVQDILTLDAGTEAALLRMRFDSPALMDSIGSDLMSRAGASDAAGALRLVSGASIQDGKYAVIRGLPDRYVSSQMNGVRLPTADEDKRAVELDQYPAVVIQSIQVSKTFTPDQQGDASGGAVDLRLKGIPDESVLEIKTQLGGNSQTSGRSDFLSYKGGGLDTWGYDESGRDIQYQNLGSNWEGAAGVSRTDAPTDYKWSITGAKKFLLEDGFKLGALASFYYERDSSSYDNGVDDTYWVETPGGPMVPKTSQGTPSQGDFKTSLFDTERSSQSVQWGALAALGIESEHHALTLTYLTTRSAEDQATLAQDTRGKAYFFPGYDPNNPTGTGNEPGNLNAAPYLRLETLEYTERSTSTLQLAGSHRLVLEDFVVGESLRFRAPEIDWTLSKSSADMRQPDKRQFGSLFLPQSFNPGVPPFIPPFTTPSTWFPYKPSANFNLGNFQRIWKWVGEDSEQASLNVKAPFEQWQGREGYLKVGVFHDDLTRKFDQDTFSNFGDAGAFFLGDFDEFWSSQFPFENHPITASDFDVDYDGRQRISAGYSMVDLPLAEGLKAIGGARLERTEVSVVNTAEASALWFPVGASAPQTLGPGEADVNFEQSDLLPSLGFEYQPLEPLTLRAAFSQTLARQTFKELTPILQQEYAGGPVFIGEPTLDMSELQNYDLRADWTPYEGGLISLSWFKKDIDGPIEYIQVPLDFTFTTPRNYPHGELSGYELELRQQGEQLWGPLVGLSLGANGTLIDATVDLPASEIAAFNAPNIQAPIKSRDMTNAPDYLVNFFLTYDIERTGTQFSVFYTLQGDTLVAGAGTGQSNNFFVPSVYASSFDTLNVTVAQKLGKYFKLQFQAKNLTDPEIEEVYRSKYIGDDVQKTSYQKGTDYSIALTAKLSF